MAKQPKYDGIRPDVKNANKGTERGRYMVEASLRETGAGRSILLDKDGRIIAGNKTFEAASDIGLPVRVVETDGTELVAVKRTDLDLDDDTGTARKLAYYDNRTSSVGLEWDAEQVMADLAGGLDLSAMFRQDELDELLADLRPKTTGDTPAEVDRAEELRQKWQTAPGQLWQLGEHRLICGDCTDAVTVARVMGGERAQAVVTDPPYGTASESKVQKRGDRIETFDIEWDKDAPIEWIPLLHDCLDEGAAVISFWENAGITTLWGTLKANGFNTLHTVYWKKTTVPQPRPNFCSSIESAVFARKQGKVLCWNGGGATPNVFEANRAAGNERTAHETQKPLTLFSWLVELVTNDGFIVYEPFSGSGTTIIACENLRRRCRAVEISAAYTAVALERWSIHTSRTPVLVE